MIAFDYKTNTKQNLFEWNIAVLSCQELSAAAAAAGGGGRAAAVVCRWNNSAQPVAHPTLQPSSSHVPDFECFGKTSKAEILAIVFFVGNIFQSDFERHCPAAPLMPAGWRRGSPPCAAHRVGSPRHRPLPGEFLQTGQLGGVRQQQETEGSARSFVC